jgi:hypothetical protein
MCHERWVQHRDEAVASRWLRDLAQPNQRTDDVSDDVPSVVDEPLTERDAVVAGSPAPTR